MLGIREVTSNRPMPLWQIAQWSGLTTATLTLAVLSFFFLDEPLMFAVERWHDTPAYGAARQITKLGESHYYLIPAAILAFVCWRTRPVTARRAALLFMAVAGTGIAAIILKLLIGRMRPDLLLDHGLTGFAPFRLDSDFHSMPSGHSATILSVAVVAAAIWPRQAAAFVALGLAIALTRVFVGAHYLSDVIAGALLGGVGTLLVINLFQRLLNYRPEPNEVAHAAVPEHA